MKKNRRILILVILLIGIALWFVFNNRKGTIKEALRDFGTKDTASIVKVFIADKKGQQVSLEKQNDGSWLVDQKALARPDAIKTLLGTIHDVEVRSPVGKAAYNNVIKAIASKGIKVELYNSKGLIKTYYIGSPTQDQLGTFMYLENSTVPFITHIPGFDGYLTPRYSPNAEDWKIKNVFMLSPGNLKSLTVVDRERPGYAFTIEASGANSYKLLDGTGAEVAGASQDKIISYLQFYSILNYEFKETTLNKNQVDSLLSATPFRSINLKYNDGKVAGIVLWRRPVTEKTVIKANASGEPFNFDVDRMTARINGDTALVVVQYFSFEKLFKKPADFMNLPPGK